MFEWLLHPQILVILLVVFGGIGVMVLCAYFQQRIKTTDKNCDRRTARVYVIEKSEFDLGNKNVEGQPGNSKKLSPDFHSLSS